MSTSTDTTCNWQPQAGEICLALWRADGSYLAARILAASAPTRKKSSLARSAIEAYQILFLESEKAATITRTEMRPHPDHVHTYAKNPAPTAEASTREEDIASSESASSSSASASASSSHGRNNSADEVATPTSSRKKKKGTLTMKRTRKKRAQSEAASASSQARSTPSPIRTPSHADPFASASSSSSSTSSRSKVRSHTMPRSHSGKPDSPPPPDDMPDILDEGEDSDSGLPSLDSRSHSTPQKRKPPHEGHTRSRTLGSPGTPGKLPKELAAKREHIIKELLKTERSYVANLNLLVAVYIAPLSTCDIGDASKMSVLHKAFVHIRQIMQLNADFLEALEKRVSEHDESDVSDVLIGDILMEYGHFFKMYSGYASNHKKGDVALASMSKNQKFKGFLNKCRMESDQNPATLESYLILPIQRLPRYLMLMRDLLKKTPDWHSDHNNLLRVVDLVQASTDQINEAVRKREKLDEITSLSREFQGDPGFVAAGRVLVRRGTLIKRGTSDKPYEFFLFSDMLAYAGRPTLGFGKLQLHRKIFLTEENFGVASLPDEDLPHVFLVINNEKTFVVAARNAADKEKWLQAFEQCVAKLARQISRRKMSKAYALSPMPATGSAMPSPISPQMMAIAAAKDDVANHRQQEAADAEAERQLSPTRPANSHPPASSFSSATTASGSSLSSAGSPAVTGGSGGPSLSSATTVRSRSPSLDGAMESLGDRTHSMPAFQLNRYETSVSVGSSSSPPLPEQIQLSRKMSSSSIGSNSSANISLNKKIRIISLNKNLARSNEVCLAVESSNLCSQCRVRFSKTKRRKTCALCAKAICSSCVTKEVVTQLNRTHPVRVCPVCVLKSTRLPSGKRLFDDSLLPASKRRHRSTSGAANTMSSSERKRPGGGGNLTASRRKSMLSTRRRKSFSVGMFDLPANLTSAGSPSAGSYVPGLSRLPSEPHPDGEAMGVPGLTRPKSRPQHLGGEPMGVPGLSRPPSEPHPDGEAMGVPGLTRPRSRPMGEPMGVPGMSPSSSSTRERDRSALEQLKRFQKDLSKSPPPGGRFHTMRGRRKPSHSPTSSSIDGVGDASPTSTSKFDQLVNTFWNKKGRSKGGTLPFLRQKRSSEGAKQTMRTNYHRDRGRGDDSRASLSLSRSRSNSLCSMGSSAPSIDSEMDTPRARNSALACGSGASLASLSTGVTSSMAGSEHVSNMPGALTSHSARFPSQSNLHDLDSHDSSFSGGDGGGDGESTLRRRRSRRTCTWTGGSENPQYAELAVQLGTGAAGSDSGGSGASTPMSSVDPASLSSRNRSRRRNNDADSDDEEKSSSYPPLGPRSNSASDVRKENDGSGGAVGGSSSPGDAEMVLSRSSLRSASERRKAPTTFSGGERSKSKEKIVRSVTPPSRHGKKKSRTLRMKRNNTTRTLPLGFGSLFKPRSGGKGKSSKSLKLQQGADGRSRDGSLSSVDSMDYSQPPEDMMSLPESYKVRERHSESNNLALPGSSRRQRRNSNFHAGTWSRGRSNSSASTSSTGSNSSASSSKRSSRQKSTLSAVFSPAMNMMRGRSKSPAPPAPVSPCHGAGVGGGSSSERRTVAEMERDARDRDSHSLRSHSAAVPLPATTPPADKRRDRRHRGSFGPDHSPKHSNRNTVSFAPQSPSDILPHPISISASPLGSPKNARKSARSNSMIPQVQSPTARSRSPPNVRSPRGGHHQHSKSAVLTKNVPVSPTHRGMNVSFSRKTPSRHSTLVRAQTSTSAAAFAAASSSSSSADPSSSSDTMAPPLMSPKSKKKHSTRSLRKALTRQNTAPRGAIGDAQKAQQKREKSKKKQKQKDRRSRLRKTKSYGSKSAIDATGGGDDDDSYELDSLPRDD